MPPRRRDFHSEPQKQESGNSCAARLAFKHLAMCLRAVRPRRCSVLSLTGKQASGLCISSRPFMPLLLDEWSTSVTFYELGLIVSRNEVLACCTAG